VIEHVPDPGAFLGACAALMAPGAALFLATLNRTPQSFALAIIGAEYILGWLPRGTHDWRRFLRPSEIAAFLRPHGVEIRDLEGVRYGPIADDWSLGRDLGVNYMAYAARRDGPS
jgi:2-polyprenyl-6-hydroxyphenyl methylase/3-demethylubiquinone-9 3-methyltransferase